MAQKFKTGQKVTFKFRTYEIERFNGVYSYDIRETNGERFFTSIPEYELTAVKLANMKVA